MRHKNRHINEGVFSAARRFTDAFFDSLIANTADAMIQKAVERNMRQEVINKMERIKREKEELEQILAKIPKANIK